MFKLSLHTITGDFIQEIELPDELKGKEYIIYNDKTFYYDEGSKQYREAQFLGNEALTKWLK